MRTVQAVAWKEIQVYFSSPTAYIVGLVFLVLTGVFFTQPLNDPFPPASISSFLQGCTFILIFLAPVLTMRLMAEEQKLGTIELLLTAPVRDWEVVLGKYLACLVFLLALVALTLYYPILLFAVGKGHPDLGPVLSGYLGLVLYGAASLSVGLLASTLTSNQIVAAVVAMGILLMLYFLAILSDKASGTLSVLSNIIGEVGIKSHFDDFDRGVIDTKHIIYYLSLTAIFIFLTIRTLELRRWR